MFKYSRMLFVTGVVCLAALPVAAQDVGSPAAASTQATISDCIGCEDFAVPPTVPPDTVVLSVNGHKYTAAEFDSIIAAIVPPGTPVSTAVRRQVAEMVAEVRVLADEAVRRGLDQDPRVQRTLELARDQALGQAVAYQIARNILDKEAREEYEKNKKGYEQIKARHILIRTPDSPVPGSPDKPQLTDEQAKAKAEEIRQRLLNGEDFAKLAAAESDDTNASMGGDLPRFRRMQTTAPFENAAFEMKVGEISDPIKSMFGYHIIQVLERGPAPYDQVKLEIARRLEPGIFEKFLGELKKAHPATLDESYFGPPPQPQDPPSLLISGRRGR